MRDDNSNLKVFRNDIPLFRALQSQVAGDLSQDLVEQITLYNYLLWDNRTVHIWWLFCELNSL